MSRRYKRPPQPIDTPSEALNSFPMYSRADPGPAGVQIGQEENSWPSDTWLLLPRGRWLSVLEAAVPSVQLRISGDEGKVIPAIVGRPMLLDPDLVYEIRHRASSWDQWNPTNLQSGTVTWLRNRLHYVVGPHPIPGGVSANAWRGTLPRNVSAIPIYQTLEHCDVCAIVGTLTSASAACGFSSVGLAANDKTSVGSAQAPTVTCAVAAGGQEGLSWGRWYRGDTDLPYLPPYHYLELPSNAAGDRLWEISTWCRHLPT